MKRFLKDAMTNATALTRQGRLKEATLTLQAALAQSAPHTATVPGKPGSPPPVISLPTGDRFYSTVLRKSVAKEAPEHPPHQDSP